MNYYLLNPEVAGELGDKSEVTYEDGKIKEVIFLEYHFMGWLGDELLATHLCFIVTESLKNDILFNGLTGIHFQDIAMTFSEEFYEMYRDIKVPKFVQMVCNESYEKNAGNLQNDFYLNRYKDIIVSEKALSILKQHKIDWCDIEKI